MSTEEKNIYNYKSFIDLQKVIDKYKLYKSKNEIEREKRLESSP